MHPIKSIFILLAIFVSSLSLAETYEISVTRKDSNIYRIDGKNIIVQTKYCYVYAYSENAYLRTNAYDEKLIFVDSHDSCDVSGVYGKSNMKNGAYKVKVSHENDNWYSIWGTDYFIQTSMCIELALSDDAILKTQGLGGELIFENGNNCTVENVYSKIRL
ncbi:hypothetical protein [Dickeya lacustris]|uniref:DUF2846 domain-containing protein n=1 Tax=Dickeya lacustris TaxID=2259638 RepID=A0ABY8G7S7_9GAMM|nr:hypothetical protein [Dickeya lacustris]WFN56016.1 hypothetical protein O1Q98_01420 [Dickeya lacustris]